jgi:T5SS/PEP-CTERM-associated repeat protein
MTKFFIGAEELGESEQVGFPAFIHLATGRSIVSGADWNNSGRVEFGLSGEGMLRIERMPTGLNIRIFSTMNENTIPPLVLELPEEARELSLREVERRLGALRTLHAIVHLLENDRVDTVEDALAEGGDLDAYLKDDEQLFLESLSPGSWVLTLLTKVRDSYKSLLRVVAMVYARGREAALRKMEAEARLVELDVEEREFKLLIERIDYGLDLGRKLRRMESREPLRKLVEQQVRALLPGSTPSDVTAATRRLLETPPPKRNK